MLGELTLAFFTAMGVVVGGCVIGSLASILHSGSPLHTMLVVAKPIKLWAVVVAMGGTFQTIEAIDSGIGSGQIGLLLRHLAMILASFLGASGGHWIVISIAGGE